MRHLYFLPLLAVLLSDGCATLYDPAAEQQQALQQRQQAAAQQERFDKLNGRIESLQMEVERLQGDLAQQRTAQGRAGSAEVQGLRESVDDLNRRLAAETAARERDRKAILDSVSTTVSSLLKSGAAPAPRGNPPPARHASTGQGVLHKVEAGQTISAIAAAYKVSAAAILEANGLKNPNQLRVGQELIIPSP